MINYYILPSERETKKNCLGLRTLVSEMVDKRRAELKKDPEGVKARGDLLSILCTDELFCNDTEMIKDECLTFFFAGSQTSANNT